MTWVSCSAVAWRVSICPCSPVDWLRWVTALARMPIDSCRPVGICRSFSTIWVKVAASWPISSREETAMVWVRSPLETMSEVTRVSSRMGRTTTTSTRKRAATPPTTAAPDPSQSMLRRSRHTCASISPRSIPTCTTPSAPPEIGAATSITDTCRVVPCASSSGSESAATFTRCCRESSPSSTLFWPRSWGGNSGEKVCTDTWPSPSSR